MALDELYQQLVLEHNRSPRHFGRLAGATHAARGFDALCGDDLLIELKIDDGVIVAAAFSGEACAVTRASASLLTDWLPGRRAEELDGDFAAFRALLAGKISALDVDFGAMTALAAVGAFPSRVRNAELPWRTALDALQSEQAQP